MSGDFIFLDSGESYKHNFDQACSLCGQRGVEELTRYGEPACAECLCEACAEDIPAGDPAYPNLCDYCITSAEREEEELGAENALRLTTFKEKASKDPALVGDLIVLLLGGKLTSSKSRALAEAGFPVSEYGRQFKMTAPAFYYVRDLLESVTQTAERMREKDESFGEIW